jgi:hypothetical protein
MCNHIHTRKHKNEFLKPQFKCIEVVTSMHTHIHACTFTYTHAKHKLHLQSLPLRCIQDAASMHTHIRAGTITGTHTRTGITSLKPQFNAVKTLHPRLRIFTHNASTENSVFEAYMRTHILTHVQAKHRHTRKHRKQCVRSLHAYAHSHTCTSKAQKTVCSKPTCVRTFTHMYKQAQTHTQAQKTVCSKPTCVHTFTHMYKASTDTHASTGDCVFEAYMRTHI